MITYDEPCEAKVANFDIEVIVDEDVVTLDVAVHDSQVVHVQVHSGAVERDFDSRRHPDLDISLHVQHRKQAVVH